MRAAPEITERLNVPMREESLLTPGCFPQVRGVEGKYGSTKFEPTLQGCIAFLRRCYLHQEGKT